VNIAVSSFPGRRTRDHETSVSPRNPSDAKNQACAMTIRREPLQLRLRGVIAAIAVCCFAIAAYVEIGRIKGRKVFCRQQSAVYLRMEMFERSKLRALLETALRSREFADQLRQSIRKQMLRAGEPQGTGTDSRLLAAKIRCYEQALLAEGKSRELADEARIRAERYSKLASDYKRASSAWYPSVSLEEGNGDATRGRQRGRD
jgi:hypothetical protein